MTYSSAIDLLFMRVITQNVATDNGVDLVIRHHSNKAIYGRKLYGCSFIDNVWQCTRENTIISSVSNANYRQICVIDVSLSYYVRKALNMFASGILNSIYESTLYFKLFQTYSDVFKTFLQCKKAKKIYYAISMSVKKGK